VRLDPVVGLRRQVVAAVYGKPFASAPVQPLMNGLTDTINEPCWPS
jgi:hypothetical protein